uniref:MYND-type domain-containing protein n=1 Tax=Peronospora matthiolae TaxID=2874970 RepID=A0AAV1UT51_9STRA
MFPLLVKSYQRAEDPHPNALLLILCGAPRESWSQIQSTRTSRTKKATMVDSDSDDELMSRLTRSLSMSFAAGSGAECAYCDKDNAPLFCTICTTASYCNETCKRRHARTHRNLCIKMRMEREAAGGDEEEESDNEHDDESDSESEEVTRSVESAGRGGGGIAVPGLTPIQVRKLLDLAARADTLTINSSLDKLQKQVSQLTADKKNGSSAHPERVEPSASLKEIRRLQEKLNELEQKTKAMTFAVPTRGVTTVASVNTPLLVKSDPKLTKYFKLKDMNMPVDQIKVKMKGDGVCPDLLDTPNAVSPNDTGPKKGEYIHMTVVNDPVFRRYFELKSTDMPMDEIKMQMEADGVDPILLDEPDAVSPNDHGVRCLQCDCKLSRWYLAAILTFSGDAAVDAGLAPGVVKWNRTGQSNAGQSQLAYTSVCCSL